MKETNKSWFDRGDENNINARRFVVTCICIFGFIAVVASINTILNNTRECEYLGQCTYVRTRLVSNRTEVQFIEIDTDGYLVQVLRQRMTDAFLAWTVTTGYEYKRDKLVFDGVYQFEIGKSYKIKYHYDWSGSHLYLDGLEEIISL